MPSAPDHHPSRRDRRRDQRGRTIADALVGLLLAGSLAGLGAMQIDRLAATADATACTTDERLLQTAQEAHNALEGGYTTEAGLLDSGLIFVESSLHDIEVVEDGYRVVPVGDCEDLDPDADLIGSDELLDDEYMREQAELLQDPALLEGTELGG